MTDNANPYTDLVKATRTNRFCILFTEEERAMIEELAAREKLSASTYARKLLLEMAEQRGITIPHE